MVLSTIIGCFLHVGIKHHCPAGVKKLKLKTSQKIFRAKLYYRRRHVVAVHTVYSNVQSCTQDPIVYTPVHSSE